MRSRIFFTQLIFLAALLVIGCGPNEAILRSNSNGSSVPTANANSEPAYDSVDSEVKNMQTADFEIILVLRRKDGGVMQSEDRTFVRNMITNANRRSLVDGEKAIVIGANSKMPTELMTKLASRFAIEDYSKPGVENNNSDAAGNANIGH